MERNAIWHSRREWAGGQPWILTPGSERSEGAGEEETATRADQSMQRGFFEISPAVANVASLGSGFSCPRERHAKLGDRCVPVEKKSLASSDGCGAVSRKLIVLCAVLLLSLGPLLRARTLGIALTISESRNFFLRQRRGVNGSPIGAEAPETLRALIRRTGGSTPITATATMPWTAMAG